jgi:hypothetical protein
MIDGTELVKFAGGVGIQRLTPAVGMFADRDVYSCFPDNGAQPKLIDLLDELGYPVDRTVKVYRQHWRFEV